MRYVIALTIAAAIILAGFMFVRSTLGELEAIFAQRRQELKEQKANGTLPEELKDADLDKMEFGMKMSENMQFRLDMSMWLKEFWFVAVAFTLVVCLGTAFLWGRIFAKRGG
jgi:hypothetical protein